MRTSHVALAIALLVGCSSGSGSGTTSSSGGASAATGCSGSTVEMEACGADELRALDEERQRLAATLAAETPLSVPNQPLVDRAAAWDKAEEAFVAYRDAVCNAIEAENVEGTSRGIMGQGCEIEVTRQHIDRLRSIAAAGPGAP